MIAELDAVNVSRLMPNTKNHLATLTMRRVALARATTFQVRMDSGRSWLATMYQLGFDFQAVPGAFWLKRSAAGASSEARYAFRTHPDAPVCNFDVVEHVGDGELLLLALRSFVAPRKCSANLHP